MKTLEIENSLKSDHELRVEEDKVRIGLFNAGEIDSINLEDTAKQTAMEFEDSCKEELSQFEFAPETTGKILLNIIL